MNTVAFLRPFVLIFFLLTSSLRAEPVSRNAPLAAVFLADGSVGKPALARIVADQVRHAGYVTTIIGPEILTNTVLLFSNRYDLLVLPGARTLPADAMPAIENYLRHGGNLMAFGLPAWDAPTYFYEGKAYSKAEYQQRVETQSPDHILANFATENLSDWKRNAEGSAMRTRLEVATNNGAASLHVIIDNLGGWNVLDGPQQKSPFPDGRTLTCFRARGDTNTHAMSIEWDERDGSRWMATVRLSTNWKSYALPPASFHFWPSAPGRGGAGDQFNPGNAARISVGLARSHSGFAGTHHEYWIANIGTAHSPFGDKFASADVPAPLLDTISPAWKFYPAHESSVLETPASLAFLSSVKIRRPAIEQAMHPRPGGAGFMQDRPWRWQPLLEARGPGGEYRGAVSTMLIHTADEYRDGIWACFTPDDDAFYNQTSVQQVIRQTASAMRRGLFLQEGGSEFFTVFDRQDFHLGAKAVNFSKRSSTNLNLHLVVKPKNGGRTEYERNWPFTLNAGDSPSFQEKWHPRHWPKGRFRVTVELQQNGVVIDRLENELNVWRPNAKPQFIEERDGGFVWKGKPWKVNGVNYMPSSGIAVSSGNYFENWLGQGAYDPEVIERDLQRIKKLNLNAVSIFIEHGSMGAQHLLDFLRRCDALGLHVNQSLRPGTPLDFQWDKMKELMEFYHMPENDTIFAYDLAWEPEHQDQQSNYGKAWTEWVTQRYGTLANAEKGWDVNVSKENAEILAVPSLIELSHDGPWRARSADYRAFLDGYLGEKYGEAQRLVHSIDPRHAVSFRMSEAGDPTFNSSERLPFELYGLRHAVDIWEPEAYGRIGDWGKVREGRFEIDYARLCNSNLPVIFAEMGYSVLEPQHEDTSLENLEFAGQYFRDFYRMMSQGGCDGIFFWWYAGGLRFDEKSDFGIINPDGTDRPETSVIRSEGPNFLRAAKPPAANYFIAIDRDADARGLFAIHERAEKEYWEAIAKGKTPGFIWKHEPGQK